MDDLILDQRHMLRRSDLDPPQVTVEDVQNFWVWFLTERHHPPMMPRPDEEGRTVVPYVNHGRWVADCPACNGGMACWEENPEACCLDCGRVYQVGEPSLPGITRGGGSD